MMACTRMRRRHGRRSSRVRTLRGGGGGGGDNGIDHNKNWLRFPYVCIFSRSHDLHPHPYTAAAASPRGTAVHIMWLPLTPAHTRRLRV
eukprot:COSAG01_NODE_4302_length_5160_cov_16.365936_6_plen_89_part_00